jgi:hypothetical protein
MRSLPAHLGLPVDDIQAAAVKADNPHEFAIVLGAVAAGYALPALDLELLGDFHHVQVRHMLAVTDPLQRKVGGTTAAGQLLLVA